MTRERSEQELVRFQKLEGLRNSGFNFPNDVKEKQSAADILQNEPSEESSFRVAGRIVLLRLMGKAAFAHILDESGKIQIYVRKDDIGEESYLQFKEFDLGDIVEAEGFLFVTKTGEKTIHVRKIRLLTKCLIPPPEKWHGLTDVEARYRQRYVDLFSNPEVRETFRKRAKILAFIRNFLNSKGFLEVETPILHTFVGGAAAKPFETHHNSLGVDMYLRVAPELALKKLLVGGFEKVYEIGKNFRNEGISKKHNPEFTMMEFYQAYVDYHYLMDFTEELLSSLVKEVCGGEVIQYGEHEISFARPFKRISMVDSIYEFGGISRDINLNDINAALKVAKEKRVEVPEEEDWGRVIEALWGELVESKLINPTFITHHPFSISPLARKNEENPLVTDRFELIIAGMEMANAFSELNDAVDQRERFEEQARRKAGGDEEAHDVDEDFLNALEYGMPPAGGEGIGLERVFMLLTNSSSIRDVMLFPQMKPED